ncbi:MAG: bacillithiol biosynthesis cysteine-adding enzyme BshC, partial [Flavobacteriaceae bacterium]
GGAVGELDTQGLNEVFKFFSDEIGTSKNAEYLKILFENAYLKHDNLTDATRFLVNELFSEYGLVILDGNDKSLKSLFSPYIKNELLNQTSFAKVSETIENFRYSIQVNPREVNLFYLDKNIRERIIKENDAYIINNTSLRFSESEILGLAEKHPEKFSPNVIMRPLYQEVILPNLCYTGGGGELAYWLELKSLFEEVKVPFPILLLRNSVLLVTEKQNKKREKLNLCFSDLFEKQTDLINRKTNEFSEIEVDFSVLKRQLTHQFNILRKATERTDKSFSGAVKAQERKQIKGLENLEKRLLKANKKYFSDRLEQIISLQNQLFPNQTLQERVGNFSEFYEYYGKALISRLFEEQKPLEQEFNIMVFY